jgi:hypothetical protein
MGGLILLREIVVSCISEVISSWIDFLSSVKLRETKIMVSARLEDMDNANRTVSSTTGFSTNMSSLSMSKRERLVAQILATKFHTEPTTEPESGVRLNPVMRDLIINGHADKIYKQAVKKKQRKRQKTEIRAEAMESVGENQLAWLSTLKEEIAKLK